MTDRHQPPTNPRLSGFSLIELMVVLAIFGIMAAIALPSLAPAARGYRLTGDARTVAHNVSLAKMRAAADFTRARLRADTGAGTFYIERWSTAITPANWVLDGGVERLSPGVAFGFGALATPPPNTQAAIAQSGQCLDRTGAAIATTICIVFNSRGVPIDSTGAPLGGNGLYLTDGAAVYGTMVAATGIANLWWTPYRTPAAWQKQQ